MKKVIILTSLVLIGIAALCVTKIIEYKDVETDENIKSKILETEKKLEEVNSNIESKSKEKNNLKTNDKDKMELLDVWQKNLVSLKEKI